MENGAISVAAFDNSETALEEARENCPSSKAVFEIASAEKLPLRDATADLFISLETIEHIESDSSFLDEVSRVLKPGGLFICSTPNRTVTNPGKKLSDKPKNIFHIRKYSESEFRGMLEKRFQEVSLFGQNPNCRTKTSLLNAIGKISPGFFATLLHQLMKLCFSFFRRDIYYSVRKPDGRNHYEYMVAVSKKPDTAI